MVQMVVADGWTDMAFSLYVLFCLLMTFQSCCKVIPAFWNGTIRKILSSRVPMRGHGGLMNVSLFRHTADADGQIGLLEASAVPDADKERLKDVTQAEAVMEHVLALLFVPFGLFAAWTAGWERVPDWALPVLLFFCVRGKLVDAALQKMSVWECFKHNPLDWACSTPSHCDNATHILAIINMICKCLLKPWLQRRCLAAWETSAVAPITAPLVGEMTIGGCAAAAFAMGMLWQVNLSLDGYEIWRASDETVGTATVTSIAAARIAGFGSAIKIAHGVEFWADSTFWMMAVQFLGETFPALIFQTSLMMAQGMLDRVGTVSVAITLCVGLKTTVGATTDLPKFWSKLREAHDESLSQSKQCLARLSVFVFVFVLPVALAWGGLVFVACRLVFSHRCTSGMWGLRGCLLPCDALTSTGCVPPIPVDSL